MKTIDQKMSKNRQKLWSSSGEKILEKILTNEDENKRLVGELRLNFRAQRRKGVKLRVNVVERRKCINKIRNNRRCIRQRLSNIKDTVRSKSPEKFSTPTTTPIVRLDKNLIDCLEKARQDLELVELEIEPWLHICKEADEDFVNKNQESILLHEINKHVGQSRRDLVDDSAIFLANLPEELKRSVSRRDAIPKAVADAISVAVEFFDDCSKLCQDCKSLESLAIDFDHNLKQLLDGNERLSQFLDSMKNCDSNKYYYAIENAVADNHCHSKPPPTTTITKRTAFQKLKTEIRALDKDSTQISTTLPILGRKITEKVEFRETIDDKISIACLKSRKYDEKYMVDRKSAENELESIDRRKQFLIDNIKDLKNSAADLPILKSKVELLNEKITASRVIIKNFDQRLSNMNAFVDIIAQNRITDDTSEDIGPSSSRKITGWQRVQNKKAKDEEQSSR